MTTSQSYFKKNFGIEHDVQSQAQTFGHFPLSLFTNQNWSLKLLADITGPRGVNVQYTYMYMSAPGLT